MLHGLYMSAVLMMKQTNGKLLETGKEVWAFMLKRAAEEPLAAIVCMFIQFVEVREHVAARQTPTLPLQ